MNKHIETNLMTQTIMRTIMLLTVNVFFLPALMAQKYVSYSCNAMRQGDILYMMRTDYVNEGESGTNKTWYLGTLKQNDKEFLQRVVINEDTIAVFEQGRILHYRMHGDTLFYRGHQQRQSYSFHFQERPVICYPFLYGDSLSGSYGGFGYEDNNDVITQGWGYTVADGTGILANETDTLSNVTRLRMFDDMVENYGGQTFLHKRRYRFLWYCAGYRYPVMESVRNALIEDDKTETPMDSVTYLFLPSQQLILDTDVANDTIRKNEHGNNHNNDIVHFTSFKATLSHDGVFLTVDFSLSSSVDVSIKASDNYGYTIGLSHKKNMEAGNWHETIKLNRKPIGNVLMLNIRCGEEMLFYKVHQQ